MDRFIGIMLDNRYEILEVIGTGGMAVVYKAKCHRLNRFVAVKILKEEYAQDEEFRRRFHDESQSVAMLSHPNIVAVYDVSRTGDVEYIVMELIEGITLKQYLQRRGPLTWKETTFFAIQIAKALEHAHSRGIIHRDIKPQNIMLLGDGTLKVADFGIARHMDQQKTYNLNEAIGSVHYVAPEQAKGSHIDNRADLYSFGVVMYEMLTARLPFEGDSPVSVAIQHINSIPLAPSDYVSDVPKTLEDITMKAMCPMVSKRYASAGDMLRDLEAFKNDQNYRIDIAHDTGLLDHEDEGLDATIKLTNTGEMRRRGGREQEAVAVRTSKKRKTHAPNSLIFSAIALLIFFAGAVFFIIRIINPFGGEKDPVKLTAPTLVGEMFDLVTGVGNEEYTKFNIVEAGERINDEKVPAGQIISQNPLPGRTIEEGGTITVVVSMGPKTVFLDNYVGSDYRKAEIALERLSIKYIEQRQNSDSVEKDMIISTDPAAGTELKEGDVVVLLISDGKPIKMVTVPSTIGMTEDQARSTLKSMGLNCGTVTLVDSDKTDKTVIFQSIPEKSTVEEGTVVDLQLSRNPEPKIIAKTIKVKIIDSVDVVNVVVKVDGVNAYEAAHITQDGEIEVELKALEGTHTVRVIQNDETTSEGTVEFK